MFLPDIWSLVLLHLLWTYPPSQRIKHEVFPVSSQILKDQFRRFSHSLSEPLNTLPPAKRRIDGLYSLIVVRFDDATCINPEVLYAIQSSLLVCRIDLVMTSLALASTIHQVSECNLLGICLPCVRQYSILGKYRRRSL